jgi:hypothetical protein
MFRGASFCIRGLLLSPLCLRGASFFHQRSFIESLALLLTVTYLVLLACKPSDHASQRFLGIDNQIG